MFKYLWLSFPTWSDADAILDQDLVGRTLANHGSERHSVDHAALLGRQAGVSERAGILAYVVDAGVLRGAVGVSAALGLHRGLRYGRLLHCGGGGGGLGLCQIFSVIGICASFIYMRVLMQL